jgi:hypothetical protein
MEALKHMAGGVKSGWRSDEDIAALLEFRKKRAIDYFTKAAEGMADRECPVCGYSGRFSPVRHKVDVWCPSCDSRSRHRLIQLWLDQEKPLPDGCSVLHFAAEDCLRPALTACCGSYVTADLNDLFDVQLDIQDMALADASYDVVIANHVLEHVDDARALAEIARVLTPGGLAVITVPIIEGWDKSYEDPTITDAETRRRVMSDPDHLRWYGRDIRDKIAAAGLIFDEYVAKEPDVSRCGLARAEKIFLGRKPAQSTE